MPKTTREKYPEIIISHPGADFDSLAGMWAAHLLHPNRPVVLISGTDTNVREFLALYGQEFPTVKLNEIDIGAVRHLTVVDCSNRSQLGRIEGLLDRAAVFVEVWDHHKDTDIDFKIDLAHFAKVGANTTMLVQELVQQSVKVSPEEATLLLLGIYEDTGSLRFTSTTPEDLIAASWLLRAGALLGIVDRFLGIRLNQAQKELLTHLGLNVRVVEVRGVPIHVTQAVATEFVDEIAFLVRKVQETESADVLFALVQLHDRVFIVGRSRIPAVNVGQILSIFGGGGHPQAASCLLTGITHPIALQRLMDAVREQVMPTVRARDIMSKQVRTVDQVSSIEQAHALIAHTGYSGLVVTDGYDHVVGVLTRSGVDKALEHGLGHAPVKGYMIQDPVTIGEDATVGEIQNVIIEKRCGFLPVVFAGKVAGVVTRSDILRALHKAAMRPGTRPEPFDEQKPEDMGKGLLARLPESCLDLLALAGEVADSNGVSCFLVGGIVRDLILSHKNADIDLLIEGDGMEYAHHLSIPLNARVVENPRFHTAKVVIGQGVSIDIATARDEFYLRPGALPEVEAAGIRDDLVRRDFTINTLAIQLNARKWGLLIDHFGGMADIGNGLIRVLHTFSFVDDPTRLLRALRFSERYGFKLENQTRELFKQALMEGRLDDVGPDRVREEILLCLREEDPWGIIARVYEEGVIGVLYHGLYPPASMSQREDPVKPAIEWLSRCMPDEKLPERELFYIAFLLSESAPEDAVGFTSKFRFDRTICCLAEAVGQFLEAREKLSSPIEKASELASILETLPIPYWAVLAAGKDDSSPERVNLQRFLMELKDFRIDIDGDDLIRDGFEPGPAFSKALAEVRRAKMDGEISGKEEEISLARKILRESEG